MSQAAQNCVVSSIAQNGEIWRIHLCFSVTLRMTAKLVPVYSQLEVGRQPSKKQQINF